ncbi:hypothetical protein IIA79_03595, partial [bacterium]|nr:hypothetical protein [bacterium]
MIRFAPIAIVGRACVLPGVLDPDALWQAVIDGRDLLSQVPAERWRVRPSRILTDASSPAPDRTWSDRGGYVRDFEALRRALKLQPKDADSLWWYGQVHQLGLADLPRARRSYMSALEVEPNYAAAQESLAVLCEAEGKWIEAIDWRKSHYRRTLLVNDLVSLADLYLRLGNVVAARKYA